MYIPPAVFGMSYRNESHCKNCRKLASTIDLSQVGLERRVLNQVNAAGAMISLRSNWVMKGHERHSIC